MSPSLRIAITLLAASILGFAVSGQTIYARLAYLWLFLVLGNYLLSRLALRGIQLHRSARLLKAQVGQIFEEGIEIRNTSRMPRIWLEAHDSSTLPGSRVSRVLTLIGSKKTRSYVSRTLLTQRGAYELGPTQLRSGDPFGFFSAVFDLPARQTLTVYPRVVEIASFPSPPGLLPGGEALRRRTHQITPNAATVRDYANGDPLSRIHWASTARRDRLIVKEFELDPLAEVWLFLDVERSSQAALPHSLDSDVGSLLLAGKSENKLAPTTEEYASTVAASVARYFLQRRRAVGLMAAGQNLDLLAADRGARQFGKIMEILALLRSDGQVPFAGFVSSQARNLTRGSTVVLITPTVKQEVTILVDQLLRLGLRPITILLDAASFGGAEGSRALSAEIEAMGAPSLLLSEGQDIALGLQRREQATPAAFWLHYSPVQ